MNKRFHHWIKLQRKYRSIQQRLATTSSTRLTEKLDRIGRRLQRLNRQWKLGISTAALTAWLAMMPSGSVQAQVQVPVTTLPGIRLTGEFLASSAGDINGDGIDDVIIGEPYAYGNDFFSGAAYIVFGSDAEISIPADLTTLDGSNGFKIFGDELFGLLGYSVSEAGDVNGDGMDDLIIGASYASSRAGASYVIFGKNTSDTGAFAAELELSTLDGSNGFKISGETIYDQVGSSVSAAGDINGDGIDDMLVGAPGSNYSSDSPGLSYVVFGRNASATGNFASEIQLSTLDGTNGFKIIGETADDNLGSSVSAAGDINGDGIDDFLIGAPNNDSNGNDSGATYVVFGKNTSTTGNFDSELQLTSLDGTNGFKILGEAADDNLGSTVNEAGDLNGDGIADLLFGAANNDSNGNDSGAAYVIFGKNTSTEGNFTAEIQPSGLDGTNGFRILGETEGDLAGSSVSVAGDLNRDGINDLLIGAPGGNTGSAYIVLGRSTSFEPNLQLSNLDGTNGFKLLGEETNPGFGGLVNAIGNFNGDGFDDLMIGTLNNFSKGPIYLVFGSDLTVPKLLNPLVDAQATEGVAFTYTIPPNTFVDLLGDQLTLSATLADGAPLPDWLVFDPDSQTLVGTPGADDTGTFTLRITATGQNAISVSDTFKLTVFNRFFSPFPSLSSLSSDEGFRILGNEARDLAGRLVSEAGDVNGDGIDDLLISANISETYVVFGSDTGLPSLLDLGDLDGTNGFTILGSRVRSLSGAGDVNGDGIDDILIGNASSDLNGVNAGTTYVIFGKNVSEAGDFTPELQLSSLDGTNGFQIVGESMEYSGTSVSAEDINGDGIDDILIGATGSDRSAGATYVVFGKNVSNAGTFTASLQLSDLDGTNGFKIFGEFPLDRAGISVSGAGDVNGDGINDVLIGAFYGGDNTTGAAYVVFGKETAETEDFPANFQLSSLNGTNGFKVVGEVIGDLFGGAVSGAGDVNGDGIDDILVGARANDGNRMDAGATYVVFGKNVSERGAFAAELRASSLNGTNGFKMYGESAEDQFGISVSGAGDVNGDGISDLLIGAVNATFSRDGIFDASYVIFGRDQNKGVFFPGTFNLSGLDPGFGVKLISPEEGDLLGQKVSSAGDVNADGIDDVIVGASRSSLNGNESGTSYVIFGRQALAPVLPNRLLADTLALIDTPFNYEIPSTTFYDPEEGSLSFSAILADDRALPAWLSFNAVTRTFSGTPNPGDLGSIQVKVTAADALGLTVSDEFTIIVKDGSELILSIIGAQTVKEDELLTFTATATDPEGDALTFSLDQASVDKGMTIDATTGAFSWTPTASDVGDNDVTISVSDGVNSDSETFIITVNAANQAPVLTAIGAQSVIVDELLSFTAAASDPESDVLTFSLDQVSLDNGMTINATTGAFSWTPTTSDVGDNEVTLSVSDGVNSDSETFIITVNAANQAPLLTAIGAQSVIVDELLSFTAAATDADGDALTFSLDQASVDKGMAINATTGAFSWTPTTSDVGDHEVTISVTDGKNNDSETFVITVKSSNEAPVLASFGAQTVKEDELLSFTATATDPEGDALTFSLDQASVDKGMTIDANTGVFSWTPTANDVGDNEVTLSVSDGVNSDSETFIITVNAVNQAPVLEAIGTQSVTADELLSFTATAIDPEGDALTFSLDQTSVDKGMTIDANTGVFSWTPTASDVGDNEVTLSVSDGVNSDSEMFVITVETRPLGLKNLGEEIIIHPNPTNGRITFEGLSGNHRAVVYSQSGALLMTREITNGSLDLNTLESGNYLIIIKKEEKVLFYSRIVKTN